MVSSNARNLFPEVSTEPKIEPQFKTILIVDDDPWQLRLVHYLLSKSGHRLICAGSGAEALNRLRSDFQEVDAIITDLIMPDLDGVEFLKAVSSCDLYSNIPTMVMSANVGWIIDNELEQLGVAEIILKPLHRDSFLEKLSRLLHEPT
jgi:CheY-like chemotaxis protein